MSSLFKIMYCNINKFSLYDNKYELLCPKIFTNYEIFQKERSYSKHDRYINFLEPLLRDRWEYQYHFKVNSDMTYFSQGIMGLQFFISNYIDNTVSIPIYFDSLYGCIDISGSNLNSISNIIVATRDARDVRIGDFDIDNDAMVYSVDFDSFDEFYFGGNGEPADMYTKGWNIITYMPKVLYAYLNTHIIVGEGLDNIKNIIYSETKYAITVSINN